MKDGKEQRERRAQIISVMKDPNLIGEERQKIIQSIMNGRRRSSNSANLITAASAVAAFDFENDSYLSYDDSSGNQMLTSFRNRRSSSPTSSSPTIENQLTVNTVDNRRSSNNYNSTSLSPAILEIDDNGSKFTLSLDSRKMEQSRPECTHYQRQCSLIAPCCGLVFGCRVCHDQSDQLPSPLFRKYQCKCLEDYKSAAVNIRKENGENQTLLLVGISPSSLLEEEESSHTIDRFSIKEIICRQCYTRQSSKTNNCISCGIKFGEYHCAKCNLWMSSENEPYHCDDCGFCRVGGNSKFQHCFQCGICIDIEVIDDHDCKKGKYMCNCPICQEDLFSSRSTSHELPCGHVIHWHCFQDLIKFDSRCPICQKTVVSQERMAFSWKATAAAISYQSVPLEYEKAVSIKCIDCGQLDNYRRWHFLGIQCLHCTSFNTTVENTLLTGFEASKYFNSNNNVCIPVRSLHREPSNIDDTNSPRMRDSILSTSSGEILNLETSAHQESQLLEESNYVIRNLPNSAEDSDRTISSNIEENQTNLLSSNNSFF